MSTGHNQFILKRSWVAFAFRVFIFILITFILFKNLVLALFVPCFLFLLISFYLQQTVPAQVKVFQQLSANEWTLIYIHSKKVHRVKIKRLINHLLYVVIELEAKQHRSVVIWCDQLPIKQWKNLQVLVKLF